jgi:hypothetical protein
MATIDWPSGQPWLPTRFALSASNPRSAWVSFFTGQQQSIAHAGQRLRIEMTLPACSYAAAAAREAYLMQLASTGDLVRLWHFQRPMIAGDLRGDTVVYQNTAAGARSLRVGGARPPKNLLTATTSFESAADWTYSGSLVVTANQEARPDSASVFADVIDDTSNTSISSATQTRTVPDDGQTYTGSIYVLKTSGGTSKTFRLLVDLMGGTTVSNSIRINTDNGNILAGSGVVTSSADNRYWRLSTTITNNASGNTSLRYLLNPAVGQHNNSANDATAMGSHVVWGAQLEAAPAVTTWDGTPDVKGGDVLGAGSQLLIVQSAGAAQSSLPYITVPLAMPLRTAVTAGQPVTWFKPTGNFQLLGESLGAIEYMPGRYQSATNLQFVEVF